MRASRLVLLGPTLLAASVLSAQPTPRAATPAITPPAAPRAPGAAERARYVGHFTLVDSAGGGATPLRVYEDGGVLLGQLRANTPSRLLVAGRHAFRPADAPDFTLVFTVDGAHATRVAMRGPGLRLEGRRDADAAGGLAGGAAGGAGSPVDSSRAGPLYDALARQDSLLFDASYVRCDTARVYALLTDDVEFYHDVTGAHRGATVRADFARLARNCPRTRGIRREVVAGSLHVYPIHGFGAVQTGVHRFVEQGAPGATEARFVHVWRQDGDAWRATRILSLDHHAVARP